MNTFPITAQDIPNRTHPIPVTGGVPIAESAAPEGCCFHLTDASSSEIPLQTSVLARWKDGSTRWVLLDFQADPPAGGAAAYMLSWNDDPSGPSPVVEAMAVRGEPVQIRSGALQISIADEALVHIGDRLRLDLRLVDAGGLCYRASVQQATVEADGPLRCILALQGAFQDSGNERWFQFRCRISIYAGLPYVRVEPLIFLDADEGIMQRIRELSLILQPNAPVTGVDFGDLSESQGVNATLIRQFQVDDQHYAMQGCEGEGGRAPGWIAWEREEGPAAVALKDFWQQWPKSLEASSQEIVVGLLPRFTAGDFDHMQPWHKYQYLFDGDCYQLRTGQARRWDVWIALDGNGPALAGIANAPRLPVADPASAIETGVWDAISPVGTPTMQEYDAWAENLFHAYCNSIKVQRDYGAMNWGDWYGERQINWGNHEYDTTNQLLIQFARTGDPRYFAIADAAARHSSEVDTVHYVNADLAVLLGSRRNYPPRPGMVHQHTMGHVSGYYPVEQIQDLLIEHGIGSEERRPYPCTDAFNLGHIWTQGLVRHYFLTGDPFIRETVERIGDNLAQLVEDREYQFMGHTHCGRTTGWPLLALAGAYEIGLGERYLNAMRTLTEDALADQDPVCGGWLIHPMAQGHCLCKTARHTGMAGFITAVLINGLSRYYLLSGGERLREAVEQAVTFLDNDTWREEWCDWRYTSCPATRATGQPGVVVMAHVNSVRISGNAEHLRVLRVAWGRKFERLLKAPKPRPGFGKSYTSTMYGCAEAIGLLTTLFWG